jgi:hypothetical protein
MEEQPAAKITEHIEKASDPCIENERRHELMDILICLPSISAKGLSRPAIPTPEKWIAHLGGWKSESVGRSQKRNIWTIPAPATNGKGCRPWP